MKPGLIVICGPTATGKSQLALTLAAKLSSPILSADSRQVYREFDLGTAKPSSVDRATVPHYLIDLCNPTQTLTLAQYQAQAQALIAKFHDQGQTPFLVGGTGLYIQSVVQGLKIPRVPPQPELRLQLKNLGQDQLYCWLQQVDPETATQIHAHDQVRTLRALEVFYVTGVPLSQQQGKAPPPYPMLQIGLDCINLDARTARIHQRTDQMLAQGWLDEVTRLINRYGTDLPLLETLGYRELKQYLAGDLSFSEAKELIVIHTRQFAKRQRTWFRADPTIVWFDCTDPDLATQVWQQINQFACANETAPELDSPQVNSPLLE